MHYRAKLAIFADITIIGGHISSFLTKKKMSVWYFLLMLIPIVNIFVVVKFSLQLKENVPKDSETAQKRG